MLDYLTTKRRDTLADTGDYSEPLPISHDTVRLRTTLSAMEDAKEAGANGASQESDHIAIGSSRTCRNDHSVEGEHCQRLRIPRISRRRQFYGELAVSQPGASCAAQLHCPVFVWQQRRLDCMSRLLPGRLYKPKLAWLKYRWQQK